ncbi:MAG: hypothetical protein ACKO0V_18055 [bacterium]
MNIPQKTLSELNHEAIRLLSEQIGVADTLRFIGQFTSGHGDYTEQRREWVEKQSLDQILDEIRKNQNVESHFRKK